MTCRPRPLAVGWGVRRLGFILLCLALGVAGARGAGKWITAQTDNFILFSSASEAESRELLEDLERLRAVLRKGFNLPPAREPVTRVMAFSSRREFNHYKPLFEGKTKTDVVGYHSGGDDAAYIAIDLGSADRAKRTIYHEYLHQMASVHDLNLPLWLNEGFAEFYSTFRMKKGEVILGDPIEEHVRFLRQVRAFNVRDLVAIREDSPAYNEGFRQGVFYAQSWALVHYLLCGKSARDNAAGLSRYMTMRRSAVLDGADTQRFEAAFGVDYETIEKELTRYLRGGRYNRYTGVVDTGPLPVIPTFVPADPAVLDCALIELQWRAQQTPAAKFELLTLAEANPTRPEPHESLGAISWRENQWEEAVRHWRRAAELGSRNPWMQVQVVNRQITDFVTNQNLDYRLPDPLAAGLRDQLLRALEMNADYGDAYELLALTEAFAATPDIANVNRVQRQAGKIERPQRLLLALAILRWRVGDTATGLKILQALEQVPAVPPTVQAMALKLRYRLQN